MDLRVPGDPSSHYVWRDAEAARLCTERLVRLAREAQREKERRERERDDEFMRQHERRKAEYIKQRMQLQAQQLAYGQGAPYTSQNAAIDNTNHGNSGWGTAYGAGQNSAAGSYQDTT